MPHACSTSTPNSSTNVLSICDGQAAPPTTVRVKEQKRAPGVLCCCCGLRGMDALRQSNTQHSPTYGPTQARTLTWVSSWSQIVGTPAAHVT